MKPASQKTAAPANAAAPQPELKELKPKWLRDAEAIERKRLVSNVEYQIRANVRQYREITKQISKHLGTLSKRSRNIENFDSGLEVEIDHDALQLAAALAVTVQLLRLFLTKASKPDFQPLDLRMYLANWQNHLACRSMERHRRPSDLAGLARAIRTLTNLADQFLLLEHRRFR